MGDSLQRLGDSQTLPRGDFMRDGSPSTHLLGAPPQTPAYFLA